MSNQRPGKTHRAGANDGMRDMQLRNFFRSAKQLLEETGNDDAAFYFEQCEDWIRSGKSLSSKPASYILGVWDKYSIPN